MTLEALIPHLGYAAILLGTFLEGETVLILGGFAAHQGYLRLPWVILAAFLGTLAGDLLFFFFGRRHSAALLQRRPDWEPRLARAQRLIARRRTEIILAFRFLYGLRTIIPFALGMSGMPVRLFAPLNVIGAAVWAAVIGSAGYFFGHALEILLGEVRRYELWIMLALALLGGGLWLWRYYRRRAKEKTVKR